MASRNVKLISVALVTAAAAGGWFLYNALAAQAQGALAQAPLNEQTQVPPAFMMAIDDSGSMTYHNQFPGADGKACWDRDNATQPWSFFITSGPNAGQLRTVRTGESNCNTNAYSFSYGSSPRNGESNNWRGIPPVDTFGFARSPDFNPAYFDPTVTYQPWQDSMGVSFGNASLTATRIDPRPLGSGLGTVSLTDDLYGTQVAGGSGQLSDRFAAFTGMVLPSGTEYRLENWNNCGGLTGGSVWRTLSSDHQMTGTCNVFIKHRLATFYLRSDDVPAGYESVPRTRAYDACGPDCDMWRYDIRPSDTAALQNFANWFSYYGNRHRALVAGLTRSLNTVNNMRVGYFRISQHGSYDNPNLTTSTSGGERVSMRDMAVQSDKDSLFTQILATPSWSSTYNRQSVYAAGQQFKRRDPLTSNAGGAPVQLACQKNAVMLFTDGYSNSDGPNVGNIDGGLGAPFEDGHHHTMADIAMSYYLDEDGASPLRDDLTGGLVPVPAGCSAGDNPKLDCQSNLHINFYGITLNGRGDLYDPNNLLDPYTDSDVYDNWPGRQNDNRSTIDDIWHATVNTRGELVNARTPADITDAMRRILAAVMAGASPSGTLALTGSRISTRSLTVQPSYEIGNEGTDWFSELAAFQLAMDPVTRLVTETQIWEASDRLGVTSVAARRNQTWYGAGSTARQFNSANVDNLSTLCNNPRPGMSRCSAGDITTRLGINISQAVDYLMGDTTNEVRLGGVLRDRTTLLGDIVNSTPVVSAPTDDYGYRSLPSPYGTTYNTYMSAKEARPAMVYVGANDGMLHAFHGGIDHEGNLDTANGGRQQFAYIPRAVLGHMGNLLYPYLEADGGDQRFDHRYFVDGPLTVSDAYYGGSWKTVLVGTAGAGGRTVFGLNVSDPTSFTAASRLWEVDDQHSTPAVRNNIGHVLGKPVVVPVKTGPAPGTVAWKAIFGNGYNSNDGKAVLFVVDIQTGAVQMTEAVEPGAPTAGTNGLGNIVVVDRWGGSDMALNARDGFADTVYAADQKGAIWKFDLRTMVPSIDTPVFTTQEHTSEDGQVYRQPIIGGLTATAGRGAGVMLLFGTGSFSFVNDAGDESIQSIYGVLDVNAAGTLDSSDLFQRSIETSGEDTRTISTAGMPFGYSGWYLNLPAGERAVGYPRVASGVLFIPTYAPTIADGCSTQGMNWLYGLNTRTGGPALESVRFGSTSGDTQGVGVGAVALDTLGTAPVKDVGLTVLSRAAPPNPGVTGPADDGCWMRITVPGMAEAMFVPYPCGRQSWRQIQ